MILFVELCVDLKKGKLAKDGLYQYKNTAQNTNVGTIEVCQIYRPSPSIRQLIPSVPAGPQEVHRARRCKGHRSSSKGR